MFPDLSWSHMLLVLIVALVVVGPKDLPKLMRKMGQWTAKARGMADQFRRSFDEMARQSELDELRKELDELRNTRPLAEIDQQMSQMLSGPAVSMEPAVATETLGEVAPPAAEVAPLAAEPVAVIEHREPDPGASEPGHVQPQTDQHPPAP
jgi:sec-independent protein translocase protein TatB